MNPSVDIRTQITEKKKLESMMMRDKPVVPPDSVIRTFSHLRGDKIDLILTQDGEGLCQGSFILRRGEWAKFFLDTWFDPLYRSYNFQKAEGHALVSHTHPYVNQIKDSLLTVRLQEHVVQWHPTILTKLALIPQKILNAYGMDIPSRGGKEAMYSQGDFIVRLVGCELDVARNCEREFEKYYSEWKALIAKS